TLSVDGANQSATGQASDLAGNIGSVTRSGINIDQAQPTISIAISAPSNANGWNDGPVNAHFTCTDVLSGIAVCPPDQVVSADGPNQTVSGSAIDRAGNIASVTSA